VIRVDPAKDLEIAAERCARPHGRSGETARSTAFESHLAARSPLAPPQNLPRVHSRWTDPSIRSTVVESTPRSEPTLRGSRPDGRLDRDGQARKPLLVRAAPSSCLFARAWPDSWRTGARDA
jgi:hypothetical protein